MQAVALQEAKQSSEIENIVTTNDLLYRGLGEESEHLPSATKEVLRYGHALWHGIELVRGGMPLCTRLFREIVNQIRHVQTDVRDLPGTCVQSQVDNEVVYTPPDDGPTIRRLLDNLSKYYHQGEDGVDPLIRMAVAHYQFEAIHPFPDGNGRTGRILNILHLIESGLLDQPVLYLSGAILQTRTKYYEGLRAVTEEEAWELWVDYVLSLVEDTARETIARIQAIRAGLDKAKELARASLGRTFDAETVEVVFEMPYTKLASVLERTGAHRQTASTRLKALESIGILRGVRFGREIYYVNDILMSLLTSTPVEV